jgi:hypothetical protein
LTTPLNGLLMSDPPIEASAEVRAMLSAHAVSGRTVAATAKHFIIRFG